MIVWLLLLLTVSWTVVYRYRRRNMYRLAATIPALKEELPVYQSMKVDATPGRDDIMTSLQKFSYSAMENDGSARGWLFHILYFIMVNPVDLEMVLKTCLEKDDLHSPKIVENFVDVFSEQSEKLVQLLISCANVGNFSIWPFISTYSLDSIFETAMGVKLNAQGNPGSEFLKSMNYLMNLICKRIFRLWLQPEWLFKLFPQSREHDHCIKQMHDFTDDVIRNKREEIKSEKLSIPEMYNDYDLGAYKRKTFLDLLISLSGGEKGYNNEELREEAFVLMVAGTDTSAVAVGYTLKLVVKESLRLFPPVPFIIRKVLEDTKLRRTMPAGSGIVVSIWGLHRDPKYWGPDAEHFDPDRFLPERFNVPPCSYMPFSSGPRNCLGKSE
ncbi:Cytochrome CYP341A13 [Operophtera brumata]|uniref:Cytochrome CYP341A13 n=1 Tax=Operophtera brumata TaxID=104452 RepID=A0A0L7L530_OPEBR|nr:Cytochrome CYP341A13 [Operophtera brumata]